MELLKKLTAAISPSGNEGGVGEVIKHAIKDYVNEISVDVMGNIIAIKKGINTNQNSHKKKLMLAAHADEIGIMVTFIEDSGFIRFTNIGGVRVHIANGSRVRFLNGTLGVVMAEETAEMKDLTLSKMYIDIGVQNKDEAGERIAIGDVAGFIGDFEANEHVVVSKSLDNRIGCYVLIESLKNVHNNPNDIYAVFTSQEELGLRGATTAAYAIEPDMAIAIDVTKTGDTPGSKPMSVKMGAGAAIKVRDNRIITHHAVRDMMVQTAKDKGIAYQLEVLTAGGTDAGAIHLTKSGVPSGVLSIPTRHVHSTSEMASIADINAAVELLSEIINK